MLIVKDKNLLIEQIDLLKKDGKTIGFVPTMGALHKGHISLIKQSDKLSDVTVVSIFVNPTQFNNKEDLKNYPRDVEKDIDLIKSHTACKIIFCPEVSDIYEGGEVSSDLDLKGLDKVMEGKFRPGHFQGVVTIVEKFFRIVKPNFAFFGKKDFQQLAIINFMTSTLKLDVNIVASEIIREENGLAMSSRNELLTEREREISGNIYGFLKRGQKNIKELDVNEVVDKLKGAIKLIPEFTLEYFNIVDSSSLIDISDIKNHKSVTMCIAVFIGKVRLIDNIQIEC